MSQLTTEDVIARMLQENTGRHFLDSGSAYGRHWERNQGRAFADEPACSLEFRIWHPDEDGHGEVEITLTANIYHWLVNRLDYAPDLQRIFDWFVRRSDEDGSRGWLDLMESFCEWLRRLRPDDVDGVYWSNGPTTFNSYNESDGLLSQTIQGTVFSFRNTAYVLLQIHGGCDVRGGYTAPKIFRICEDDASIVDWSRGGIGCKNGHCWDTDDAYHWYEDGGTAGTELTKYPAMLSDEPFVPNNPIPDEQQALPTLEPAAEHTKHERNAPGFVRVDSDHNGYCPLCGEQLTGGIW